MEHFCTLKNGIDINCSLNPITAWSILCPELSWSIKYKSYFTISPSFFENRTNLDRRKFGVITSKKTSWLVVSFPICHEYTAIMINPKKNSSWICNKVRTILPINWNPKANYFFDIVQRISKVICPPSPLFFFFLNNTVHKVINFSLQICRLKLKIS